MGGASIDDVLVLPLRANDGLVKYIGNFIADKTGSPEQRRLNRVIRHKTFSCGEYLPKLLETGLVKGKRVILVDSLTSKVNPNERAWTRLALTASAVTAYGAREVHYAAFPLWGARQDEDPLTYEDRPEGPIEDPDDLKHWDKLREMRGEAFSLQVYIDFISRYAQSLTTASVHNEENTRACIANSYGTAEGHFFNLDPFILFSHFLTTYPLKTEDGELLDFGDKGSNVVFMGFDRGAWPLIDRLKRYIGFEKAGVVKNRKVRLRPNDPKALRSERASEVNYQGLTDRIVVTGDDLYDTGGTHEKTFTTGIDYEKEGVPRHVIFMTPYPHCSGEGFERIERTRTNMITGTFRPHIADHDEYGSESINVIYPGAWLAEEFLSIMAGNGVILTEQSFPHLDERYLQELYEVRGDPIPIIDFTPHNNH